MSALRLLAAPWRAASSTRAALSVSAWRHPTTTTTSSAARTQPTTTPARFFSLKKGKNKFKKAAELKRAKARQKNAPLLKDVLRKFVMKVHPDRLVAHPEARAVNESSMQEFNNFITALKSRPIQESMQRENYEEVDRSTIYPKAMVAKMRFYVLAADGKTVSPQTLLLRTTGGMCAGPVHDTLSAFFAQCGLADVSFVLRLQLLCFALLCFALYSGHLLWWPPLESPCLSLDFSCLRLCFCRLLDSMCSFRRA
jgi:hypothetical protein